MIGGDSVGIQSTLRALSDPTRREILNLLKKDSMSAGDISGHFEMSVPAVSKHLSILKDAGLIRDRREGKYMNMLGFLKRQAFPPSTPEQKLPALPGRKVKRRKRLINKHLQLMRILIDHSI